MSRRCQSTPATRAQQLYNSIAPVFVTQRARVRDRRAVHYEWVNSWRTSVGHGETHSRSLACGGAGRLRAGGILLPERQGASRRLECQPMFWCTGYAPPGGLQQLLQARIAVHGQDQRRLILGVHVSAQCEA